MTSNPDNRPTTLSGRTGFSPWGSRSATPKPQDHSGDDGDITAAGLGKQQRGRDHAVSRRHRLSLKDYPKDCPRLNVQWYHAVDVSPPTQIASVVFADAHHQQAPKRKPLPSGKEPTNSAPPPAPKKYVPFSENDSRAIEAAFQTLADEEESATPHALVGQYSIPNTALKGKVKVPVNEDWLFDVDVENRELGPAYWLGPIYDVRRGTWFYSVGAGLSPCDENLATQLEEGYLRIRPWAFPPEEQAGSRASTQNRSRPESVHLEAGKEPKPVLAPPSTSSLAPGKSTETLKPSDADAHPARGRSQSQAGAKSFRLFGAHMNSMVTYQNATTAWLLTDDFMSRMSSNMYERFAGGGHFAGVKIIRGFDKMKKAEPKEVPDVKPEGASKPPPQSGGTEPGPGLSRNSSMEDADSALSATKRRQRLGRQMTARIGPTHAEEAQEEEARKENEREMEDDYREDPRSQQGREIEHVILVTHGIGQRLGLRIESVNFVHDVNTFRRTVKDTYLDSPDLQALNGDIGKEQKNSRIQVLPVCWRHLLDFPKQSLKHNRQEHDLGDLDQDEDDEYPSLEDINVEGVPAIRNLITDLALDILLYQSPAYKNHITRIVLEECNRVYALFMERNPGFHGKISLVGHSLGSAIMFDILCKQPDGGSHPRGSTTKAQKKSGKHNEFKLDFAVEDFYALGSPIGLFQMLKGRKVSARTPDASAVESLDDEGDLGNDTFEATGPSSKKSSKAKRSSLVDITTSSPLCAQVYNIFHPTDPIAYRIEPLISKAMSPLKPQPLPYTKKGIFGAPVGQGLTGIGARVGQSVSGLWSSFSTGIASSLLNRSLGLSNEQAGQLGQQLPQKQNSQSSNDASAEQVDPALLNDERKKRLAQDNIANGDKGPHPRTLIDAEMETLYAGFQRHVNGEDEDGEGEILGRGQGQTVEEQARRLRREEAKVRALNSNGRVDYSIQE